MEGRPNPPAPPPPPPCEVNAEEKRKPPPPLPLPLPLVPAAAVAGTKPRAVWGPATGDSRGAIAVAVAAAPLPPALAKPLALEEAADAADVIGQVPLRLVEANVGEGAAMAGVAGVAAVVVVIMLGGRVLLREASSCSRFKFHTPSSWSRSCVWCRVMPTSNVSVAARVGLLIIDAIFVFS